MKYLESTNYRRSLRDLAEHLPMREGCFLVTGATGLIGSCMIDVLLYANREMGRKYRIYAMGRSEKRLKDRFPMAEEEDIGLKFLLQDVREPIQVREPIDYVVHAASNADPRSYALHPADTLLINVEGTRNILEFVRSNPACRFLFTSSFEVYGSIQGVDTYSEEMYGVIDCNRIRSVYPESKRASELLVRCYCQEFLVKGVIARLASIYGPTMLADDSKAHAQFIRNGLAGSPIVLKSEGLQRRTYCYVMDTVDAMFWLLEKGTAGEIYNISNEKSVVSIAELAQEVAELCETRVVFELPDAVESQGFSTPQHCILDNKKLRDTGWEGQYSLRRGLSETITILKEIQQS